MGQRNSREYEITEHLTAVFTAICDACDRSEKMEALESDEVAASLYSDGWRVNTARVLLCPKCVRRQAARLKKC